ncbi:PIG-L family deacetylase [Actinomycetospora sp. NBRC 106378]|uniref:PIG-L deacetylase family protein n=1 Tax=Actinomycetospora sp. NBRC 106378 TaxID=3032208 RepID=UPI0025535D34|nr:PIG-L family deacetylase [Actinomycetospora sp. NBRC 106378]
MTTRLHVVVAHPDDETFGCGSLLLYAADRGVHTVVTCLTRGEAGEIADDLDAPRGVGALREDELRAAASALGVAEVEVGDLTDSGMDGEPAPDSLCGVSGQALTDAVADALARHRADVVVTLDGGDGHRDHRRLRQVLEGLLVGGPTPLYLQCLPRSLMYEWIRHHAGDQHAAAYTELPEIGTPDDLVTTLVDTGAYLASRTAAIALHRSQRSPFDGLPADLSRRFLGREHLIRANPPWTGGPVETALSTRATTTDS